jgi:Domain of unknown function (DUF6471)
LFRIANIATRSTWEPVRVTPVILAPRALERTQRFVKAELKRADVTYEELAAKLREMGLQETKISIASKLSRAGFSASFFLAVMKAIGREQVNLTDV